MARTSNALYGMEPIPESGTLRKSSTFHNFEQLFKLQAKIDGKMEDTVKNKCCFTSSDIQGCLNDVINSPNDLANVKNLNHYEDDDCNNNNRNKDFTNHRCNTVKMNKIEKNISWKIKSDESAECSNSCRTCVPRNYIDSTRSFTNWLSRFYSKRRNGYSMKNSFSLLMLKRLSLPPDLRLSQNVVRKLNELPNSDQQLSRTDRRMSLNEVGFGKAESYQKLEKLGEGTYATVFKGKSLLTGALVALKQIRLQQEEGAPCTAIREVSLLRNLRHANVVTLHDIIYTNRMLTLVFENLDKDLKQYMESCGGLINVQNIRLFLFQLLRGLNYCHARRVLHRDLKPQNLLISCIGELKLADFGLARAKSIPTKAYSHEVVTLWYRPPDVLLGATDYSTHIDIWGVGCIMYEMATGTPFFPGNAVNEQLHLIFKALGTPQFHAHPLLVASPDFAAYKFPQYRPEPLARHVPRLDADGINLLTRLLRYEGVQRCSAKQALEHPYFGSLPALVHGLADGKL